MIKVSGSLFFLAGAIIFMGITTAEIFYPPGYSISQSMISTLGASPPPDSVIKEPSAGIFDSVMVLTGLLILVGTYLMYKAYKGILVFSLGLMGLGALGVGIFPAFHVILHPIVALIAFSFGGISAILSSRVIKPPFSYLSLVLGSVALLFLVLGVFLENLVVPILGRGGTERWVAYPIMIWLIGFGGYLMSASLKNKK